MSTEQLCDYLKRIFELETKLYALKSFRNDLNSEISDLRSYRVQPRLTRKYIDYSVRESMDNIVRCLIAGVMYGPAFGFFGGVVAVFLGFKPPVYLPLLKTIFIYGPLTGLIIGSLIGYIAGVLQNKKERNEMLKENQEIDEKNAIIDRTNREEREKSDRKIKIIEEEVYILNNKIKEVEGVLEKYYNKNIIYPKYRYFVAIASFYEYLSSRRCDMLEGHEGAYNIFENEMRQNIIISKLDDVIRQLDNIQKNQYMLYAAIKEQNSKICGLVGSMNKCVSTMERVENSNEIIAYNSQVSTDCLEYFKWIDLMDTLVR